MVLNSSPAENELAAKSHLDQLRKAFEIAWKTGKKPRIEDYLQICSKDSTVSVFEALLKTELALRNAAGNSVDRQEYCDRFPGFKAAIHAVFGSWAETEGRAFHVPQPKTERVNYHLDAGDQLGDYLIVRQLGQGGFGVVYLARDMRLERHVALKVARPEALESPEDVYRFRQEAQNAARIHHAGVATIYTVAWDHDPPFIVQEFIDGRTLTGVLHEQRPAVADAVKLVAEIAEIIAHAHEQGVYHRDLKPSNILIDRAGRPRIVDFGLALREEERQNRRGECWGTAHYMSPEQVRGESHRLDGRCDIWSLGVILYEMLVGQPPFGGATRSDVYEEILQKEVRPPRQLKPSLPVELERICLKCLSKRISNRYTTGIDLATDLRCLDLGSSPVTTSSRAALVRGSSSKSVSQTIATAPESPPQIVPKGLRSFDEHDADFFLEFVPGPRDRYGLPETIRFWKNLIEEADCDGTFSVGLLYGPSGCGKSSLVRAGLLPRLAPQVVSIYVEASSDESLTNRLLRQLRKQFTGLPAELDLPAAIAVLRQGNILPEGSKVLIVFDQFEQWLHGASLEGDLLINALRQCDGGRVQALIMVRDDFWLAISRFMSALEIRIVEGQNSALVDQFDREHATRVLEAMGRAYGRLPADAADTTTEQREFVKAAIESLSEAGKVNGVRVALFAEMMKDKTWTPANLKRMGGVEGVGVAFMEDRFDSRMASPACRYHQVAVRAVLGRLLPEHGADIRGQTRSYSDLMEASGYTRRQDFEDLLRILDGETRLITPTDRGRDRSLLTDGSTSTATDKYYQLSHDYLVPSLREWLTRKQRETRRGRAAIRLAERSELWNLRRETNQLPSFWETVTIRTLTSPAKWTAPQQRMMKAAMRLHSLRLTSLAVVLAALFAAAAAARMQTVEMARRQEASAFVDQVLVARLDRLPGLLEHAPASHSLWRPRLAAMANDPNQPRDERLRAHLALNRHESTSVPYLVTSVQETQVGDTLQIRDELLRWPEVSMPLLWKAIAAAESTPAARLRLASCLAAGDRDAERWTTISADVASALVGVNQLELGQWTRSLEPVATRLLTALETIYLSPETSVSQRTVAAQILATFAAQSPELLARWLVRAGPDQFPVLFTALAKHPTQAGTLLEPLLSGTHEAELSHARIQRQTRAAIGLVLLGMTDAVWPLLFTTEEPDLRTSLIASFATYGTPLETLATFVEAQQLAAVRSALILAMGQYSKPGDGADARAIIDRVALLYEQDPDSDVHAACEWLLRRWSVSAKKIAGTTRPQDRGRRNWWINSQGQTMVVLSGPASFTMGSPVSEPGRDPIETPHRETIGQSFAISSHEVTVEQFLKFNRRFDYVRDIATPQCPVNRVDWYSAARYCRWLSEQEGVEESQMCYPPLKRIGPKMELPADFLLRTGYRLPTESEWEYACRGGTGTSWCFGDDDRYLTDYAWFVNNSLERTYPVGLLKPNGFGLFDTHGNIQEWCHDLSSLPIEDEIVAKLAQGADVRAGERSMRGGSFKGMKRSTRSAKLMTFPPESLFSFVGFRIARTLP